MIDTLLTGGNKGFNSFDRYFLFSENDIVGGISYDGPYEGMVEADAYAQHWGSALEDSNRASLDTLLAAVEVLRETLRDEAKDDIAKWDRWFFDERFTLDEAMDDLARLITVRHAQYKYELDSSSATDYPYADEKYSDQYYASEYGWRYVVANQGMIGLLSFVLVANVLSFLIPDFKQHSHVTKMGWLHAITGMLSSKDANTIENMSTKEILTAYVTTWLPRILTPSYVIDVLIAVFFLVGYTIYVRYDFTDDSEILGHHYLLSIRFVWLYFAIAVNLCFLVRDPKFRILSWILIVLGTNLYGIVDLFEFSQVTGSSEAVNSRGAVVSLDSDNSDTFYLYVSMRLLCQAVVMRYSLEIPSVSIQLSESIEAATTENLLAEIDMKSNEVDLTKEEIKLNQNARSMEMVVRGQGDDEALALGSELDGADAETETVPTGEVNKANKDKMKKFMHLNMAVFILICVGFIIYIFVSDLSGQLNFRELFFSVLISVAILINIRAFYSCMKWFWLHAYGKRFVF